MKPFKHSHFAIIPLLSILAMSPTMVESKFHSGRSIASIKEEVKGHPRYEAAVSKIKPEEAKDVEITKEKFQEKLGELKLKLTKEKEDFKKDQSDETIVSEQRKSIESLVAESVLVEGSLKKLEEGKLIEEAEIATSKQVILESKDILEGLLTDLEANEVLVVKAKEPKKEDKPVIAEEPKKEEPKKEVEEPKKDEVKPEVAKEEPKKEEPKKEDHKCEASEQNKVLTKQVEDLMKQNQQILQSMLGMSQMMVSMYQNMQQQNHQNPFYANGPGWNQSPYQYNQPQSAGNWVYYPQGFQPQQPNIFAQPQPQYGMYPDSFYMSQPQQIQQPMQQSQWMLNADPRYTIQNQFTPGSFGGDNSAFTFNMGQQPMQQQPMNMMAGQQLAFR